MELGLKKTEGGFGEVLKVAWPASLTMLNTTIIKFVDGAMVAGVDTNALNAQFVAGMGSFVPEAFVMGLLTVVNTYVAQNFGRKCYRRTGQYAWAGLAISMFAALLLAPLAWCSRPIFSMFTADPAASVELINLEVMYFRYMMLTLFLTLSARVLEQFFYGIHRPKIVLAVSILSNGVNVLLNYMLIFGHFGAPRMGLEGAAIGTVTAWGLQVVVLMAVFFSPKLHREFYTRRWGALRLAQIRDLLRLGWPAGLQIFNDIFCWFTFLVVIVGKSFGELHLAGSVIVQRYLGLSFMPAVGIGIATTALVGRSIGEGRVDLARRRAHLTLRVAMIYMGICGLVFWLFRYPLVEFFLQFSEHTKPTDLHDYQEIIEIGGRIMICAAVFQLFNAVAIVYTGALRGAGDTRWPMVITMSLSWSIIIGGGFLAARTLPQLQSIGPWLTSAAYVIILGVALIWRFESGAWKKINLFGRREATQPAVDSPLEV